MSRKVAIVGMGAVTPLGNSVDEFWENIVNGKSGVRNIKGWDTSKSKVKIAGTVENFSLDDYFLERNVFSRASQFALHAAREALTDANLLDHDYSVKSDSTRTMSIMGTWAGSTFENDVHAMDFIVPQIFDEIFKKYDSVNTERSQVAIMNNILLPLIDVYARYLPEVYISAMDNIKSQRKNKDKIKEIKKLASEIEKLTYNDYLQNKYLVRDITNDRIASIISSKFNIMGETQQVGNACASGITAIGEAYRRIKHGYGDVAICGASDAANFPYMIALFSKLGWLSNKFNHEPENASRPFDMNPDNFVQAEGSGVLILEELEHAKARGADIKGMVKGYSITMNPDARGEFTSSGYYRALENVMNESGLSPEDITYSSSCAVAFHQEDYFELVALDQLFDGQMPYVSSIKSFIGHPYAAAGPIQAIANIKSIEEGIILPTRNLERPHDKYSHCLVTEVKKGIEIKNTLASGHGLGNHCSEMIIGKDE